MAVTFGCPLVGPYNELCGKHLKVGQRAYATNGAAISNGKENGKSYTNWKTGAVDKNGNLIVYENLPWDTNMGGDTDSIGSNTFIITCEVNDKLEISNLSTTYEEIKKAHEEGKIIKAIGTVLTGEIYILDLVALQDGVIIFNGVCDNMLLTFFVKSDNSGKVNIRTIQTTENLIQSMDGNENVIDCYPSAKAVADYVANHSGSRDIIDINATNIDNIVEEGLYRVGNSSNSNKLFMIITNTMGTINRFLFSDLGITFHHKTPEGWSDNDEFLTRKDAEYLISSLSNIIIDNLFSSDTDKALSANQGRVLNEKSEKLQQDIVEREEKSNKAHSINNANPADDYICYPSMAALREVSVSLGNQISQEIENNKSKDILNDLGSSKIPTVEAVRDYVNSVIKEDPQDNSKLIITLGDKQYKISVTEII